MANKKVTLYVKSIKTAIGTEKIELQYFSAGPPVKVSGWRIIPKHEVESVTKYRFVLPEDQNRIVEIATEIAPKYGFKVEVVDVTKENILHRALQEEVKGIRTFPTLITDSGEKIEGTIIREQIKSVLSRRN